MKDDIKGKSLLSRWKVSEKKKSQSVGLDKAPSNEKLLPSHGQQRLWFLQHLYPKNPVYNYSEVYTFKGNLNPDFLRQSLQTIYTSNTILRTFFELVNGELISRIDPKGKITIKEFDLSLLPSSEMTSRNCFPSATWPSRASEATRIRSDCGTPEALSCVIPKLPATSTSEVMTQILRG